MSYISNPPVRPSEFAIGFGNIIENVTAERLRNTVYQNPGPRPLVWKVFQAQGEGSMEVSENGTDWKVSEAALSGDNGKRGSVIVRPGEFYRLNSGNDAFSWSEMI
jgi:hypothetical protein